MLVTFRVGYAQARRAQARGSERTFALDSYLAEVLCERAVAVVRVVERSAAAHRTLVPELGPEEVVQRDGVRAEVASAPYERADDTTNVGLG